MIEVIVADITTLAVDAIVNAANVSLLGGAGVDGAIHRAAGPGLLVECRALPESSASVRCPVGEARLTSGHALPARHIIHTVGPRWSGGECDEPTHLRACYRACLTLAREHRLRTVAFPSISTGIYGFPIELAAPIATEEMREASRTGSFDRLVACCFDKHTAAVYRTVLGDAV